MINWKEIDHIFLDMDGTLLDLRFDNYFWQEFVPYKYAERHTLPLETAKSHLLPRFKSKQGTLEWYCLDHWSEDLQLDIAALKTELIDMISILPYVIEFLTKLQSCAQQVILVTNAHRDSLDIKMSKTGLFGYFDAVVSSHDFGLPKEHHAFWQNFHTEYPFDKARTLLIDDSIAVLNSARLFGIKNLISISKPDSSLPKRDIEDYMSIEDFRELLTSL
jgi:putative hydrolase of the HAD superfamily